MTNFEKYKDEILEISRTQAIAINKRRNAPEKCSYSVCSECLLHEGTYCNQRAIFQWLYSEYQEPAPKLTKTEKGFCEVIEVLKDGYIARDKNGELYLYNNPPYVTETDWRANYGHCTRLCSKFFPFITWESGKAWSIEDLLKLEVCDD